MEFLMSAMTLLVSVAAIGAVGLLVMCLKFAIKESRNNSRCEWKSEDDYNTNYNTNCGNGFYNSCEDGEHVTKWAKYCPYCGKKIMILK